MNKLSAAGRLWRDAPTVSLKEPRRFIRLLLEQRGLVDDTSREIYLAPSLSHIPDPALMADMDIAVKRIISAIKSQEHITVYGDYDVDGVSSATILVSFLRKLGAKADFYIPDRRTEGYGLNLAAVEHIATQSPLMITVDCGITSVAEVARANELGCNVIIVDHHQVPDPMPAAIACLNPHRPDCRYPFKPLCAAGVAFMLAIALRRTLREQGYFTVYKEPDVRELLDVVALATVADMVPLEGINRILVHAGLQRMTTHPRAGIYALMKVAGIDPEQIKASHLGFQLGPRINARGRLEHAGQAVELLLSDDKYLSEHIAQMLDHANRERRRIESETVEIAMKRIQEEGTWKKTSGLVLYDPTWHPGILGLVASRVMQKYHRPTIVIGEGGKGSGRSIPGVDLHHAMHAGSALLEKFGGHKAAAGLTIIEENIDAFRACFQQDVIEQIGEPPYTPEMIPDLTVNTSELNLGVIEHLRQMEPFGHHNPAPLFVAHHVPIKEMRIVGEKHLKLRLGNEKHDAIMFNQAPLMQTLGSHADIVFGIEENHYRGNTTLQLRVEDVRTA